MSSSSSLLHVLAEREDEKRDFEKISGTNASLLSLEEYQKFARRYIYYRRNKVEDVEKVIQKLLSNDPNLRLKACCAVRKIFFIDNDTKALKKLVNNDDFLQRLLSFFDEKACPLFQYEAVWTFSIFYNTPECLPDLVEKVNYDDIVPILADLLHSPDDIRWMAFFCLGKLASTSEHISDSVVKHALLPLLADSFIRSKKIEKVQIASMVLLHCRKAIVKMDSGMVGQVFAVLQNILLSIDTSDNGMDTKDKGKTEMLFNTTQALASIGTSIANQVLFNNVLTKLVELLRYKNVLVVNAALHALANFADNRIEELINRGVLSEIVKLLIADIEDGGSIKNRAVIVASRILANGNSEQIEEGVCHGLLYLLLDDLKNLHLEEKQEVALAVLGIASHATPKTRSIVEKRLVGALDFLVAESRFSAVLKKRCSRAHSMFQQRYSKRKRPWYSV